MDRHEIEDRERILGWVVAAALHFGIPRISYGGPISVPVSVSPEHAGKTEQSISNTLLEVGIPANAFQFKRCRPGDDAHRVGHTIYDGHIGIYITIPDKENLAHLDFSKAGAFLTANKCNFQANRTAAIAASLQSKETATVSARISSL